VHDGVNGGRYMLSNYHQILFRLTYTGHLSVNRSFE